MAAELKQEFGLGAELIQGKGGIFDVHVDGKKVFSKHETGRFPDPGEITGLLNAHKPKGSKKQH